MLSVRVTPKGGQDCILPFQAGDTFVKLKVAVPPEDGKANQAVVELFSKLLRLPKSSIILHSGAASRQKRFYLSTQAPEALLVRLAQAMGTSAEVCFTLL